MEYVDVVDSVGKFTGKRELKSAVHQDGSWHMTVHIWCVNDRYEVLMQRRAPTKEKYANFWDISVAGHVSSGESPRESAVRELLEEIGVTAVPDDLLYIGTVEQRYTSSDARYVDNELCEVYFLPLLREIDTFVIQKEELTELKWVPLAELGTWITEGRADLVPLAREYALLKEKFSK